MNDAIARMTWEGLVTFLSNLRRHGRNPDIAELVVERLKQIEDEIYGG